MAGQLGLPPVPVTAVVVAPRRGAVARRLRDYKDAPVAERRREAAAALVGLVDRWSAAGGRIPAGTVVTVPSTTRPGPAPVDGLVAVLPGLARRWLPGALVPGPDRTGHLRAARHGFRPADGVPHRLRHRCSGVAVVVDDAYTTGARAQSAAAALHRAGIRVAGILVIGRLCGTSAGADAEAGADAGWTEGGP